MINFTTYLLEVSRADQYEIDVASEIDMLDGFSAKRPKVSSKYSDILVTNSSNKKVWIEVKMNHTDNLGNTRVFYDGSKWDGSPKPLDPLKKFCVNTLNASPQAAKFIADVSKHSGIKNPKIPTTLGGLRDDSAVPLDVMKDFFSSRNRYIVNIENQNLGKLVEDHYLNGKAEPAYYMQAGDDFYMIGSSNPLNLPRDIPKLSGFGDFKMRVSTRSRFYEVQPEVKIKKMPVSKYSIKPGTSKKNPFTS